MKKSRYSEEQIIGFLRQAEAGMAIPELCRSGGFSQATFYKWRAKYGGMQVSDAQRLRELESENAKHKILDAMGDLYIIGKPILGAYSAFRSGHALNNQLLRAPLAQPQAWDVVSFEDDRKAPVGYARPAPAW